MATGVRACNVRELLHFAERVVLGVHEFGESPVLAPASRRAAGDTGTLSERMDRYEAGLIRDALALHGGDVASHARPSTTS